MQMNNSFTACELVAFRGSPSTVGSDNFIDGFLPIQITNGKP